jgi:hypothetical protein
MLRAGCVVVARAAVLIGTATCSPDRVLSTRAETPKDWRVSLIEDDLGFNLAFGNTEPVVAPDTVRLNSDFGVTIYTISGGCIEGSDSVHITMMDSLAVLIPYDRVLTGGSSCLQVYYDDVRTAHVQFAQVGQATLAVKGLKGVAGSPLSLMTITKTLVVIP